MIHGEMDLFIPLVEFRTGFHDIDSCLLAQDVSI